MIQMGGPTMDDELQRAKLRRARATEQYEFVSALSTELLKASVGHGPLSNNIIEITSARCVKIADRHWHELQAYTMRELDPDTSIILYDIGDKVNQNSPLYSRLIKLGWEPPKQPETQNDRLQRTNIY
jgi:hypothetical protein